MLNHGTARVHNDNPDVSVLFCVIAQMSILPDYVRLGEEASFQNLEDKYYIRVRQAPSWLQAVLSQLPHSMPIDWLLVVLSTQFSAKVFGSV